MQEIGAASFRPAQLRLSFLIVPRPSDAVEVRMRIELEVNGRRRAVNVDPARSLLSVLREELELTGAKLGCGESQCGACTVLLAGRAVRSCVTSVASAAETPMTTIEGLERAGRLHPLPQAFLDETALQCGFCTPG